MLPDTSLEEALGRARAKYPSRGPIEPPPGTRPCATEGCMTLIANDQLRRDCYFHGGEPNPPRKASAYLVVEMDRIHRAEMRRLREAEREGRE